MAKNASIAAPAAPSDPPANERPAVDDADRLAAAVLHAERRLRLLQELTDIGMDMTRRLQKRVAAVDALPITEAKRDDWPSDAAAAFAKLSRAVRLTIDLEARTDEALRALCAGETAALAVRREKRERAAAQPETVDPTVGRDRVAEQVAMVISRECESEADSCDLLHALEERLEDDIAYVDVDIAPLREMVEKLCGDLGLSPDWSRWTVDGWPEPPEEVLGARAPWSPFNRVSRKPLLYKNRNYERREFEVIDPSP
jgi:hypothetical protein